MHHMGVGLPIGYSVRITQNNDGQLYRGPGGNGWGAPNRGVHISLLGDPTLRLHPVSPPTNVTAERNGERARVSWNASAAANLLGYHVYRAPNRLAPFVRLTPTPISATTLVDDALSAGAIYQVRAIILQRSPTATYYNQSQGIFAKLGEP